MSGATFPILVQIPTLGPATLPINPDTDYTVVSQNGIARKVTVSDFIVGNFATLGANTFTGKQTLNGTPVGLEVANNATIGGTLAVTGTTTLGSLTVSGTTIFSGNVTAGRGTGGTGNGVVIGSTGGQSVVQNISTLSDAELYLKSKGTGGITVQSDGYGTFARFGSGGVTSPVNYLLFSPAASGAGPTIQTAGSSTNRDIRIVPAGTGVTTTPALFAQPFTGGNIITYAGAPTVNQYPLRVSANLAGLGVDNPSGGYNTPVQIAVPSDTVKMGSAPNGVYYLDVRGNVKAGFEGCRSAISAVINIEGAAGAGVTDNSKAQFPAIIQTFQANSNVGGTSFNMDEAIGIGYGGGDQSWLLSGATYWTGPVGREIDVGIYTGATAAERVGLQIVSMGNVQGVNNDVGLRFTARLGTGSPGFKTGVAFYSGSVDGTSGDLMAFTQQPPLATGAYSWVNAAARNGIAIQAFDFTTTAFRSAGGFRVTPDGYVNVGSAEFKATTSAVTLDAVGYVTNVISSFATGSNFLAGNKIWDDYGNIVRIDTVDGSGVPLTWTLIRRGGTVGSAPANPIQFYGGRGVRSGVGTATVNMTWTRVSTLNLNTSGGPIIAGGYYSTSTGYRWNAVPFISANVSVGQTIFGYNAGLNLSTSSIETTAIGHFAGGSGGAGITGAENTLVGWHSGFIMTTGGFNTAVGVNTMGFETTGNNNVAVGTDCMRNSVAMVANVAVGANAMRNGAGTIASVAVGHEAMKGDETVPSTSVGSDLVAIGYRAMYSLTRTTATAMVAIGTRSGTAITTANGGVLVGHESGKSLTTALHIVAVGNQALLNLTTGPANIAIGRNALQEITTEANNVAVGHLAGQTLTGAGNTLVGKGAGALATTADNMVAIGLDAGKNVTGDNNIIIGGAAASTTLTSGSNNILIGNVNADVASASDSGTLKIAMGATPVMSATSIPGTPIVSFDGGSISIGAAGAPTITSGSGVPATTTPKGSIYFRTGGAVGSTLYVSQGGGTWNAVAGV